MPTDNPPLDAAALAELRADVWMDSPDGDGPHWVRWPDGKTYRSDMFPPRGPGVRYLRVPTLAETLALLRAAERAPAPPGDAKDAEIERLRAAVDRLVRLYKSEIAEYDAIGSHEIVDSMHRQLAAALAPPSEPAP
jgi:hypothetical protein